MSEFLLPYRTDWPAMLQIVDYIKGNGVERSILDARFGGGEGMRERLNALEQLGFVERADQGFVRLSERGKRLAYAVRESERQDLLLEAIADYLPYRMPLLRAHDEGLERIDGPWLERVWQVDMRLDQPRNRVEEARTFFLRLAETAGLGAFRRGVRGQPSRLELDARFADLLRAALETLEVEAEGEPGSPEHVVSLREATRVDGDITRGREGTRDVSVGVGAGIAVQIQVDMSDWDLEKIAGFFDLLEERVSGEVGRVNVGSGSDISHEMSGESGGAAGDHDRD
ncbi:MAG: hypothetical protein ACOC9Y_01995 [Chloroflexota bacterium]